jgi:hypothetical protein
MGGYFGWVVGECMSLLLKSTLDHPDAVDHGEATH